MKGQAGEMSLLLKARFLPNNVRDEPLLYLWSMILSFFPLLGSQYLRLSRIFPFTLMDLQMLNRQFQVP